MALLDDDALERSAIVANSLMNRERVVAGVNSYERELRFNPLEFIREKLELNGEAAWLDLCCGTGRALISAARQLGVVRASVVDLHGIDLVSAFDSIPPEISHVRFSTGSVHRWQPTQAYDLITCVHGLHYIGDKLGLIARALSWLKAGGVAIANLDLQNVRHVQTPGFSKEVRRLLTVAGVEYRPRQHLLYASGPRIVDWKLAFVGADDQAGPNYSGQAAVDSYYRESE